MKTETNLLNYRAEITEAMRCLSLDSRVIFIGQGLWYPGHVMYSSLEQIPKERKIEVPVFEDTQMGISIGLALKGYIPVSIYPRMDFLMCAMNQLVNHLDKMGEISEFLPKVIIRTMIGSKVPLDGGPQHTQDYTKGLRVLLNNVHVLRLDSAEDVRDTYKFALKTEESVMVVEYGNIYK